MSAWTEDENMPDDDRLRDLLVGRKVVSADIMGGPWGEGLLTLDDGTTLRLWGNEGCGWCPSGYYDLTELNRCDNAITNVETDWVEGEEEGYDGGTTGIYRIFVFADARHLLASFEGDDGNGYYGTGWWLSVKSGEAA